MHSRKRARRGTRAVCGLQTARSEATTPRSRERSGICRPSPLCRRPGPSRVSARVARARSPACRLRRACRVARGCGVSLGVVHIPPPIGAVASSRTDERVYRSHVRDARDGRSVLGLKIPVPALPEITVRAAREPAESEKTAVLRIFRSRNVPRCLVYRVV